MSITADSGLELASKVLGASAYEAGGTLSFIWLSQPAKNADFGSFNGRFPDECMNA